MRPDERSAWRCEDTDIRPGEIPGQSRWSGDLLLVEDIHGKGHSTRITETVVVVAVELD